MDGSCAGEKAHTKWLRKVRYESDNRHFTFSLTTAVRHRHRRLVASRQACIRRCDPSSPTLTYSTTATTPMYTIEKARNVYLHDGHALNNSHNPGVTIEMHLHTTNTQYTKVCARIQATIMPPCYRLAPQARTHLARWTFKGVCLAKCRTGLWSPMNGKQSLLWLRQRPCDGRGGRAECRRIGG